MSDTEEDHIAVHHHESAIWSLVVAPESRARMCASIGSEDLKVTVWRKDEKVKVSSNTNNTLCKWIPTDMTAKLPPRRESDEELVQMSHSDAGVSTTLSASTPFTPSPPSITLHHTSIISAVFIYQIQDKTFVATSDIKDEIYIWNCDSYTPISNLKGDILWIGTMESISHDSIAMIMSPSYNCELWDLVSHTCRYSMVHSAFNRIDYCAAFSEHGIFAFSLFAVEGPHGEDDYNEATAAIQFWKYNIDSDSIDFYYELRARNSERDTVSAMTVCEDLLISGHADKTIKIRNVDALIRLVESSNLTSLSATSLLSEFDDNTEIFDDHVDNNAITFRPIDLTEVTDARYVARIGWTFIDTEDNINFKIVDIVKQMIKQKEGGEEKGDLQNQNDDLFYYKYYSTDRYKRQPPINPCNYEYTKCITLLIQGNEDNYEDHKIKGKGWVQWKAPPGLSASTTSSKDTEMVSCILRGHTEPVYALSTWIKDNYPKLLFSGGGDGTIRIWDMATCLDEKNMHSLQTGLGKIRPQCLKILRGHEKYIYCMAVTNQSNATGGCDTPVVLSGGVDTKLHIWDVRNVLYDLNWSRRCHFCMFLCVYNLLDRSGVVIKPKKMEKEQKEVLKRVGLGLRVKDESILASFNTPVLSSPPCAERVKTYRTRGKRCRVYSHKEELIMKSAESEREQHQRHVSERLQFQRAIEMSLMEEEKRRGANASGLSSPSSSVTTTGEDDDRMSSKSIKRTKGEKKNTRRAPAGDCVYSVFQLRHICSIIASHL